MELRKKPDVKESALYFHFLRGNISQEHSDPDRFTRLVGCLVRLNDPLQLLQTTHVKLFIEPVVPINLITFSNKKAIGFFSRRIRSISKNRVPRVSVNPSRFPIILNG